MILTNKYNLPSAIENAVKGFDKSYKDGRKETSLSVTELISPPLMRKLKVENYDKITEDVSDRIWVLLGSAVHSILEHSAKTNDLTEERLYMNVGNVRVSGQADLYEPHIDMTTGKDSGYGTLSDYKITSAWSVIDGPKPEYIQQLNILAYLYELAGFKVQKLQIVAILRDWSQSKAGDGSYPEIPVKVIPIERWSKEDTLKFIEARVALHTSAIEQECNASERWDVPTKWALMKKNRKSAIKLYDNEEDCNKACTEKDQYVEVRPGRRTRCELYCSVSQFCSYYKSYLDAQK